MDSHKMIPVFDYLVVNADYFFNSEEYQGGMALPLSDKPHFDTTKTYNFTFKIYLEVNPAKTIVLAISKSTDTPDEIWDGLIDIMEREIMPRESWINYYMRDPEDRI